MFSQSLFWAHLVKGALGTSNKEKEGQRESKGVNGFSKDVSCFKIGFKDVLKSVPRVFQNFNCFDGYQCVYYGCFKDV